MIDRHHPHARYHEDLQERLRRERRQDSVWTGVCIAIVVTCLTILTWLIQTS